MNVSRRLADKLPIGASVLLCSCASVPSEQQILAACDLDGGLHLMAEPPPNREELLSTKIGRYDDVRSMLSLDTKRFYEAWFARGSDTLVVCAYRVLQRTCSDVGDNMTFTRDGGQWDLAAPDHIKICDPLIR